jgi:hypothetical protein
LGGESGSFDDEEMRWMTEVGAIGVAGLEGEGSGVDLRRIFGPVGVTGGAR